MSNSRGESDSSVGSFIRDLVGDLTGVGAPIIEDAIDESLAGQSNGRYSVVALLGEGGMGRVYEADDSELGRRVAIKFLPAAVSSKRGSLDRFVRELRVTAELEHPGIVPVYDSGVWANGQPFYVMRRVSGAPLDKLIARANSETHRLALLGNVVAVADAVGFAHHHGVIHRDLKPANILIASFGETIVADWGLAKRLRDPESSDDESPDVPRVPVGASGKTSTGVVLGTPAYMAPEQRRAEAVDQRADVYAIGVILHELLLGRRPDRVKSSVDGGSPTDAAETSDGAARVENRLLDLHAIVDKATAVSPGDRYANATELADELRRFQMGHLVGARRYTRADLLKRWMWRYRALLAVGAGLGLVLLIVAITSVVRIVHERDAANRANLAAETARADTERARSETISQNDALVLLQARSQLTQDPTASLAWLKKYPPSAPDWKAVSEIASDAWSRGVSPFVWRGEEPFVARALAFSPDGKSVAACAKEKGLRVWDVESGAVRWFDSDIELGGPVTFSPDGKWVVSSDGLEAVRLWDLATGARRSLGPMSAARLKFTPDGDYLVGGGLIRGAHAWHVGTDEIRPLGGLETPTAVAPFYHEKSVALVVNGDLLIEDLQSGRREPLGHIDGINMAGSIDVSRDDRFVVTGNVKLVPVFDRKEHRFRVLKTEKYSTKDVRFSPSGELVSLGDGGILRWDVERGASFPIASPDQVRSLAWSTDGRLLLGGTDGHVSLFEDLSGPARDLVGHRGAVNSVAFSPDGRLVASASADRTVRLWRVGEGKLHAFHGATAIQYSPDGRRLLAGTSGDWAVLLVDIESGKKEAITPPRSWAWSGSGALSPDGRQVLYSDHAQRLSLFDIEAKTRRSIGPYGPPTVVDICEAFSPDGKVVAVGTNDGAVQIATLETGAFRPLGKHDGSVDAIAISPDQRTVATGSRDRLVKLWDLMGDKEPRVFRGHSADVNDVKFSRDGRKVVSCSADGTLRVWNVDDGNSVVLRGHSGSVDSAAFAPDGTTLLSGGTDGTLRLWDVATGENRVIGRTPQDIWTVAFSPAGKDALIATGLGTKIVDPYVTPGLDKTPSRLRSWLSSATTAEVDPIGGLLASSPVK